MDGEINYDDLASLTPQELNARILAATLGQGSRTTEQAMLAERLRAAGSDARGANKRGFFNQMGDALTAAKPGLARAEANQMGAAMDKKNQEFMANLLRRRQPAQGAPAQPYDPNDPNNQPGMNW